MPILQYVKGGKMIYSIPNWEEYQQYKDRYPPWIKLQRKLLDNYEFHSMPIDAKFLLPMLWLIASESKDGTFDGEYKKIAFRLRMSDKQVCGAMKNLLSYGFIKIVQKCTEMYENVPREETEAYREETEEETERNMSDLNFESLWVLYPRKDGSKAKAKEIYKQAIKSGVEHGRIESGVRAYSDFVRRGGTEKKFIAHATTWLNQRRWESDYTDTTPIAGTSEKQRAVGAYAAIIEKRNADSGVQGKSEPINNPVSAMLPAPKGLW